jgi:hypothetical protein
MTMKKSGKQEFYPLIVSFNSSSWLFCSIFGVLLGNVENPSYDSWEDIILLSISST